MVWVLAKTSASQPTIFETPPALVGPTHTGDQKLLDNSQNGNWLWPPLAVGDVLHITVILQRAVYIEDIRKVPA